MLRVDRHDLRGSQEPLHSFVDKVVSVGVFVCELLCHESRVKRLKKILGESITEFAPSV